MRDLVVLVADSTMAVVLRALFGRERWDLTLGCGRFDIRPEADIFHDPQHTDGGVHNSAQELLRPFLGTHRHAMVVLDQQFGGDRPAAEVRDEVVARMHRNGWKDRCEVVVIDPELEVWLWQDNPHVATALAFTGDSLRGHLQQTGAWPVGAAKPNAPKETIQALIAAQSHLKTKVAYARIARTVSVSGCTDPSFGRFKDAVRSWFPVEDT